MSATIVRLADHSRARIEPDHFKPYRRWAEAMAHCKAAEVANDLAWWDFRNAQDDFGKESAQAKDAYSAYSATLTLPRVIATSRAIMTPAPDRAALAWKIERENHWGGAKEWSVAIAADRERLGLP